MKYQLSGEPDQVYRGVHVVDVVMAVRDLERGWYLVADLHRWYGEACVRAGRLPQDRSRFGATLTAMWVMPALYRSELRAPGRLIEVERLAGYWPDLPWKD